VGSRDRAATRRGNEIWTAHGFEAAAGAPPNRRPLNPSPTALSPRRQPPTPGRTTLLDENQKIKHEQVIFFVTAQ
jgi:hypothetical protein